MNTEMHQMYKESEREKENEHFDFDLLFNPHTIMIVAFKRIRRLLVITIVLLLISRLWVSNVTIKCIW